MKVDQNSLEKVILKEVKKFVEENDIELDNELTNVTRLIGPESILDSIELVSFIVQLEEELELIYGSVVELANERAMSQRTSPFINVENLSKYIVILLANG
jgi:hypothetical protein